MTTSDTQFAGPDNARESGEPGQPAGIYPKVQAAGAAGALATLIVGVLALAGVEVPETLAAALATVLAFGAAYVRTE